MAERLKGKERLAALKESLEKRSNKPAFPRLVCSSSAEEARYGIGWKAPKDALLHISDIFGHPPEIDRVRLSVQYDAAITRCGRILASMGYHNVATGGTQSSKDFVEILARSRYRLCPKCGSKADFISVVTKQKEVTKRIGVERKKEQEEREKEAQRYLKVLDRAWNTARLVIVDLGKMGLIDKDFITFPEGNQKIIHIKVSGGILKLRLDAFSETKEVGPE